MKTFSKILIYFTTRVPDTNDTSAKRVKNFDFGNDTSENIFSHPQVSYMANEFNKERNNFILRTNFWKCLVPMPKYI